MVVIKYFPTFGKVVYFLNKGKFEPRRIKEIFVEYSNNAKTYRIWVPSERK